MRVFLMTSDHGLGYEVGPCNKRIARELESTTQAETVLFQLDWDRPGLARSLGWDMRSRKCDHRGTDGTVTCPDCGRTADEFIAAATEWLDAHDGCTFQGRRITAGDYILNALGEY